VELTNISLRVLLLRAFQLEQPSRLSAPDWVTDVNVDIHATIPDGAREHVPEMLKTLLIERFGLRARTEPRPTEVYELVVGSGGVRIQEVQAANELDKVLPPDSSRKAPLLDQTVDSLEGRVRSISSDRGLTIITERSMYERVRTDRGTYELNATRITMAQLASALSQTVDRPVIDRTKLTGVYAFRIELPPPQQVGILGIPAIDGTATNDPSGASPFAAVEKLGLKLESRRVPMDTVVVDSMERFPREN
jgi:uncharacterized protein (TIGR03435 family)